MFLFDVIIPTYNNLEELHQCLSGFAKQTRKDFKLWICVDGSTDGTQDWLRTAEFPFEWEMLAHPDNGNHGRAATRNLAVKKIGAPYVVMIDSDLVPSPYFLQNHLEIVQSGNISLGHVAYTDYENVWTHYIASRGKAKFRHKQSIGFQYLDSNTVAMPSGYLTSIGGFDANFKVYGGEDVLLGYCIHRKYPHLKFIYNKRAEVAGPLGKSLSFALHQRESFARNGLPYIEKNYPDFTELFHFTFFKSHMAAILYKTAVCLQVPQFLPALLQRFPVALQRKAVHFLVFLSMYRGYHDR